MKRQNLSRWQRRLGGRTVSSVRSAVSRFRGCPGVKAGKFGAVGLLCALFLSEAALVATTSRAEAQSNGPRLAVPAYFWSPTQWATIRASGGSVGFAVANVSTGPGAVFDASEAAKFVDVRSATTVVGYVNTSYASRSVEAVLADVDHWRVWYGVTSIFLDQTTATCADVGYYANVVTAIRARQSGFVVLNPGANIDECYAPYGDVIVNFEGTPTTYGSWSPAAWTANYPPGKFWHVVYSASESQLSSIVGLAQARRAGYLYVTPDGMPNPFDTLPTGTFWNSLVTMSSSGAAPATGAGTPTTGLATPTTGPASTVSQPATAPIVPAVAGGGASTVASVSGATTTVLSTVGEVVASALSGPTPTVAPVTVPTTIQYSTGSAGSVGSTSPTRAFVVTGVFVPPTTTSALAANGSTTRPNLIKASSAKTSTTRPNAKKKLASVKKAATVKTVRKPALVKKVSVTTLVAKVAAKKKVVSSTTTTKP